MQGLYAVTAASPLQVGYDSCVPFLLGEGQAVRYLFVPRPVGPAAPPRCGCRCVPGRTTCGRP